MARNPARKKLPTKKSYPKKAAARRRALKVSAIPKGYQAVIPYLMLSEADPKQEFNAPKRGQVTDSTMIYLDDVDDVVERAVHAGARLVTPVADLPFGDRSGTIVDPFDHRWMVSTHIEDVSPKEAERRMKAAHMG